MTSQGKRSDESSQSQNKIKNKTAARGVSDEIKSSELARAYCGLFVLMAVVVVILAGDDFFIAMYNSMADDVSPPKLLPRNVSGESLSYNDCLVNDRLLSLRILQPLDEELTANPTVRMVVDGELFKAATSEGQRRDAIVRVRMDNTDLIFNNGGNNLTIALDEDFNLSFDFSLFGFGKNRAPYKLTAEIFIRVLPQDMHFFECDESKKYILTSSSTVHFFYFPLQEVIDTKEREYSKHDNIPSSVEVPVREEEDMFLADNFDSGQQMVASPQQAVSSHTMSMTIDGADACPGFRFSKLLSLSYQGGCSGTDSIAEIRVGINIHPMTLAQGLLGDNECIEKFVSDGSTLPTCMPATFVLSYSSQNYDISSHIRSESESFLTSSMLRGMTELSDLDILKLKPLDSINVILRDISVTSESTTHLVQVYMCDGPMPLEDNVDPLHHCTQSPSLWDSLLVQCDSAIR